jgi:hypothetical protein
VKDPFIEVVHRRLCELPEELAEKDPIGVLIFITYQEARMHPLLYARHLALQWFKRTHR